MKKFSLIIGFILFLFYSLSYAAQVAIVQTDTRQEAWAKETLNNTDLQNNIDGFTDSDSDLNVLGGYLDGMSIERQTLSIVVSGTSVYLDVESTSAGDIDYYIDGTKYTLNCTTGSGVGGAARVEISQGTAIAPKSSLVYVVYSSQASAIVLSTTPLETSPSEDFAPVVIVTIQDYSSVTTNGALVLQRTTETVQHNGKGAVSWGREKLRALGAQYWSGVDQALAITTNGGSEDNIQFDTSSGVVFQLHRQSLGDVDMSADGIFVANASGDGTLTNYQKLTDLNSIHEIADGTALVTGDSINLVIWGSVNYGGENKLFVNLPNAKYTNDNDAILDSNKTAITTIPAEFRTTGYLIAKIVLKYTTADSGTWANLLTTAVETWHTKAQTFNTPNWPSDYDNSHDGYLATLTEAGAEKIRVVFTEFDTEANFDYIYLRDGVSATNVHTYHGDLGAFTSATIDGATMRVYFHSDGSVTRTGVRSIQFEYLTTAAAGQQVIDLRGIPTGFNLGASGGIASVDHGGLNGLNDDDHPQYEDELDNSAGLLAALDDETGTGLAVFNDSPTLITPAIGTPSAAVLTNATGLPGTSITADSLLEITLNSTNAPTDNYLLSFDLASGGFTWVIAGSGAGDLLADGTVPLTANWDVGAYTITGTQFISDIATGTAPFGVSSTTVVTNLNADNLDGTTWAAPGAIGGSTPAAGAFTTLSASSGITSGSSATPTLTFEDSDLLGADEEAAKIFASATTVTDGAEVTDITITYMDAGTVTNAAIIDGSDNQFEFQINTTLQAGDIVLAEMAANSVDSTQYVDRSIDSVHIQSYTLSPIILAEPDLLQPIDDTWPLYHFIAETYPSGVTIDAIHISTSATCTDVLNFEEWSNNGTAWNTDSTVEAITLSGTHTEDDGTLTDASIAADAWLYLDLPASPTNIAYYSITISFHAN